MFSDASLPLYLMDVLDASRLHIHSECPQRSTVIAGSLYPSLVEEVIAPPTADDSPSGFSGLWIESFSANPKPRKTSEDILAMSTTRVDYSTNFPPYCL